MRRGVPAVRTGVIACGAVLIAAGLTAPLLIPSAGASVAVLDVGPRSLADDTVLGTFSPLGAGTEDAVHALVLQGDDTLYAGGNFVHASNVPGTGYIAAWSNTDDTWHSVGAGANTDVNALALQGDDTLYAGGSFDSVGGVSANRIAAWSNVDDTWHSLGAGITGGVSPSVNAVVVENDDTVYAGGNFTQAGGVNRNNIARWSTVGNAWSSLGTGTNNSVRGLASVGIDTVYVGGEFTQANGVSRSRIAEWSSTAGVWGSLGAGTTSSASALAAAGDDTVYVGGQFNLAGGVTVNKVAAWSRAGNTWHALSTGMNSEVLSLAEDGTHGLVYAGGDFGTAGSVSVNSVAVWDTGISAWIPLQAAAANGIENGWYVYAIVPDDSTVYLGGAFTTAGGLPMRNIARWTWDAPTAAAFPATGAHGATIQVRGSGLIGVKGASAVRVNGTPVPYTRDDSTTVQVTIPGDLYDGTYSVQVDAVGGTATTTYTVTGSPAPVPPRTAGAPTGATAVAGDESASVSWVAPSDSGSFAISTYQVTSAPGGKSCLVSAPALTCEVVGLTNGASYAFSVRALNGAGWGEPSTASNAVTPMAPPSPSIVITGSRDAAVTRVVRVTGTTTELIGKQVTPWIRFPGQTMFTAGTGVRTVAADGTFAWSRTTGKRVHVYFTHGSMKSNTVVIPAR